jgi:hypothetical protein
VTKKAAPIGVASGAAAAEPDAADAAVVQATETPAPEAAVAKPKRVSKKTAVSSGEVAS